MKKLLMLLILVTFCPAPMANGSNHVQDIYAKVVKASGISKAPMLIISSNPDVNAYNNGVAIVLNTGLIKDARDDDEIALVLGHELAHGALHHRTSNIPNEYAADKLGAVYMRKAGYNVCLGAMMVKRFGSAKSKSHPPGTERYKALGC